VQDLALGILRLVGGACAVLGGLLLTAGLVVRLLLVLVPVNFSASGHWVDLVFAAVGLVLLVLGYVVFRAGDLATEAQQRQDSR
jgi:uncharacterized membrane protein